MKYKFHTDQFGIDERGLHLLRSRYNYRSITYADIDAVTLTRGKSVKNWLLLLVFGIGCLVFSVYYAIAIYEFFSSDRGGRIYLEEILVPVLPAFIGAGAIVLSLQVRDIIIVKSKGKELVFLMTPLVQDQQTDNFITYISQRLGYRKVFVNPDFDKENAAIHISKKA